MNILQWDGYRVLKSMGIEKERIDDLDILILPENFESETDVKKFYDANHSITLHKMLRSNGVKVNSLDDLGIPDIPVFAKHSDEIWLGVLFLQYVAIPVLINVFSDWLLTKSVGSIVHVDLKINKHGKLISLKYDGDSETLNNILKAMNKK